jgi:hypothetical protein
MNRIDPVLLPDAIETTPGDAQVMALANAVILGSVGSPPRDRILAVRDEARAFAAKHVKELSNELIIWADTALLPDGRLRALLAIWAQVDESNAMSLAESTATRAAIDFAANSLST